MLSSLLILLYTVLFTWLLFRITQHDRPFLPKRWVAASFAWKVLFGLLYGYLFMRFYGGDDTWKYHASSLVEYDKLLHDPVSFVKDTFTGTGGRMSIDAASSTHDSFWSDFEEVLFIRLLVLFDLFSFGRYYVNVVFFCFVAYLGQLLLFRLFVRRNGAASLLLALVIFFYPVVLFWLSGIRKEGLLLLGLSAALYSFDKLMQQNTRRKGAFALACVLALGMLFLIRNVMVLCVLPGLAAWFAATRIRGRLGLAYGLVYALFVLFIFWSDRVPGLPSVAGKITERQYSFMALEGKTRLPLDSLKGDPASFLHVLPQALNHSFLQPRLAESKSILQLVSALDVFLFFFCAGLAYFFRHPDWRRLLLHPAVLSSLSIALLGYLLVGYIVPFPGAFVRYKSPFELLFLAAFMTITRVQLPHKLNKYLYGSTLPA